VLGKGPWVMTSLTRSMVRRLTMYRGAAASSSVVTYAIRFTAAGARPRFARPGVATAPAAAATAGRPPPTGLHGTAW